MAKLFAELTSDKGGRVASKSGNDAIVIDIYRRNYKTHTIKITQDDVTSYNAITGYVSEVK